MATVDTETIEVLEDTGFSESDLKTLELETEDAEVIEIELTGGNTPLEDVEFESFAEDMEIELEGLEGLEAFEANQSNGLRFLPGKPRNPSTSVNKRLLKTFTCIIKRVVKKITTNPKTLSKFQAAIRQGPAAVTRILTQAVSKSLPPYFRWMAPIYVPVVASILFHPIRTQAGVKREEVEAEPEFFPLIPLLIGGIRAGLAASKIHNAKKHHHKPRR
ncbi:hypothetical protein [Nostoc sp.]|uniref:hypothetical protein n=1 Tax=Nostoc sp. TaxID=1180 RepID=UPI002FF8D38D